MRATTFLWAVLCSVFALALVAGLSIGGAGASPTSRADQSYTDPVGDAGSGTDITNMTVRNDPATGAITIQVASANPVVANHAIAIFVDSDRNQATGDEGDDYWMFGGPLVGAAFYAWNGSTYLRAAGSTFSAGQVASNISEFRFNRSDIGNVSGFNFAVASISIDGSSINFWDAAPNSGYYSYDLVTAAPPPPTTTTTVTPTPAPPAPAAVVKPVIGAPVAVPVRALAGMRMTVVFPVTRSDNGKPLMSGTMVCDPSVAGKVITHAESFKAGKAQLSFVVPKAAKGKVLTVKLTIIAGTQAAKRVATFPVK